MIDIPSLAKMFGRIEIKRERVTDLHISKNDLVLIIGHLCTREEREKLWGGDTTVEDWEELWGAKITVKDITLPKAFGSEGSEEEYVQCSEEELKELEDSPGLFENPDIEIRPLTEEELRQHKDRIISFHKKSKEREDYLQQCIDNNSKAIYEYGIEKAENAIRRQHNELERKRFFSKKTYFPYDNIKFLAMVSATDALIKAMKEM